MVSKDDGYHRSGAWYGYFVGRFAAVTNRTGLSSQVNENVQGNGCQRPIGRNQGLSALRFDSAALPASPLLLIMLFIDETRSQSLNIRWNQTGRSCAQGKCPVKAVEFWWSVIMSFTEANDGT